MQTTSAEIIVAVSWILELPRDLGLPHNRSATTVSAKTIPDIWVPRQAAIPGWDIEAEDCMPLKRLRFRRAYVDIGMPTAATDLAYGDLQGLRGRRKWRYRRHLRKLIKRGAMAWKTVCQATRWYVGDSAMALAVPPPMENPDSPLHGGFAEALEDLDLWLQAYGLASGEFDIGSLALHDLPPMVPWVMEARETPDHDIAIGTGLQPIHDHWPHLLPNTGNEGAARTATHLLGVGPDSVPFFTGFSLLFQAQSHALAGRSRQAIVDMGTAVESLVVELIDAAMRARRCSSSEIDTVLGKRWRDLYNRELPTVLGIEPGRSGALHSNWWAKHYSLRVDVVHGGKRVKHDQAATAISETWDLFEWIGESARAQPDLQELGRAIRVQRS